MKRKYYYVVSVPDGLVQRREWPKKCSVEIYEKTRVRFGAGVFGFHGFLTFSAAKKWAEDWYIKDIESRHRYLQALRDQKRARGQ
jgi:hypothetical protein